jgi:hypothetical protein
LRVAIIAGGARYYPDLVALLAACGEHDRGYVRVGGLCVSDAAFIVIPANAGTHAT